MLIYLIDGFNLFHKIRAIEDSKTPRRDLVHYIRAHRLTGSAQNKVVIVFDGYETDELHTDPEYQILFSNARTADDIIKEKICAAKHKRSIVVVSDDNEIRQCARSEGATVCRPDAFLGKSSHAKPARPKDETKRDLLPSSMMDITEELKKLWVK